MGAWGTAIFSDDTAADVRDAFCDLIADGLSPAKATRQIIAESADFLDIEDAAAVFWLALAATQWKLGRVVGRVRNRALRVIDSGADLRAWQDSPKINQRKSQLARLRAQLLSPPPVPRPLKARVKSSTDLKPGDVAVFRLDDRTAVRFCVLNVWGDRGGTYTDICLLALDDGKPFRKSVLKLSDTLGPHFTMMFHEPAGSITLLRRGVRVPAQTPAAFRAWNNIRVRGEACTWDDFPAALRVILPKLRWTRRN
jgi:Domain of unknown function (DUF4259)